LLAATRLSFIALMMRAYTASVTVGVAAPISSAF
jgi:hypothetical protein